MFVKFVIQVPTVRFCFLRQELCAGTFYIDINAYKAERSVMARIHVIGRITADLELKYSHSKNPYVRFDLAENIGSGDRARVQYYQVWAWNDLAVRLVDSKARKGSLVRISGSLELEVYTKQDCSTIDKRLKVMLDSYDFVSVSNRGCSDHSPRSACDPPSIGRIDGDRDPLPE